MESPPKMVTSDATIGSTMSGTNWNMKTVSGTIVSVHLGLGFTVVKDLYYYLIIDNFAHGEKPFNHHIEGSPPEYMNIVLSKATVLFWLSLGPAKSTIYGKEIRQKEIIDPMSQDGLTMSFKLAPLIKLTELNQSDEANDFYLKFGVFPDSHHGISPPITVSIIREEKKQMDAWHYERAKLVKLERVTALQGDYTYHFLDCGHKLRVERNGQKMSIIHFNYFGIHNVPEAEMPVPEVSVEAKPTFNLTGLSSSALYEGIEEAHWEQLRIRSTNNSWATDPSYMNSMKWVDAAWYEIQSRREEEAPVLLEEPDAFEGHY